jgi:hypothetical protein
LEELSDDDFDSGVLKRAQAKPSPSPCSLKPPRVTRASSGPTKRSLFRKSSKSDIKPSTRKRRKVAELNPSHREDAGFSPAWQTLPYHILFNVFTFAAPLSSSHAAADVSRSVRWLLNVARLCSAFYEPALAALYYSPPLYPSSRWNGLMNLVAQPQESLSTNYQNKIKRLEVDLRHPPTRHFDLYQLLQYTPQLKHLRLYDPDELGAPPAQGMASSYWEKLFLALDANQLHLHSWEWNGDVFAAAQMFPLQSLMKVHSRSAFRTLRSIRFLNLLPYAPGAFPSDTSGCAKEEEEGEALASTLSILPDLRYLEFRKCSVVGDNLLQNLPLNLRALSLVNCNNVNSSNLGPFLARHGHHFRELILAHNRYLNMSFTVSLAQSCPQLEVFKMDLNFTSPRYFQYDVEPYFEELLSDSEVPSWPTRLHTLELERLRKWEVSTASVVFSSLIESAPNLQYLRRLVLTAILKIGWRDRASFREQWVRKLERTFLRSSKPPNPNLRSIPKRFDGEDRQLADDRHYKANMKDRVLHALPKRQSARIAHQKLADSSEDGLSSDRASYRPGTTCRSGQQGGDESSSADPAGYTQGMCDVVDIRIDNLRPADYLLTADDFSGEEVSGDDDWSGYDPNPGDDYAW